MSVPDSVEIVDVTARDGLQNESVMFSTKNKLDLIEKAILAGVKRIEVASFAHPKHVPQMADAEAVIAGLPESEGVTYIGLVMNERGLDRALNTNIDEVGFVAVSTDKFAHENQRQTRDTSVRICSKLIIKAKAENRTANVTIAAAFGCPFEGEVSIDTIVSMAKELAKSAPREITLADTIGVANPWHVSALVGAVQAAIPNIPIRAHFHNTRNTGLANAYAAIQAGVKTLDVSIGGTGGCPFAPTATGNIPAEDVVYMLERQGIDTGMDLCAIIEITKWLSKKMGKTLPGMVSRAGIFPDNVQQSIN